MKTDYLAHDARYLALRERGAAGWDTAEGYRAREPMVAWALGQLAPVGPRLLELGCGAGNMAAWLVERGFHVTGIDISPTAIAGATEQAIAGARFVEGNIVAAIPGTYDVILDGNCLHCIVGADRARLLANVHGALAAGGSFIIATMCGEVTIPALQACFDPVTRCQIVDGVAYRYIGTADAILEELGAAGFEIVASALHERASDDDQDHLWAIATRR